jgi:hypothetical protein
MLELYVKVSGSEVHKYDPKTDNPNRRVFLTHTPSILHIAGLYCSTENQAGIFYLRKPANEYTGTEPNLRFISLRLSEQEKASMSFINNLMLHMLGMWSKNEWENFLKQIGNGTKFNLSKSQPLLLPEPPQAGDQPAIFQENLHPQQPTIEYAVSVAYSVHFLYESMRNAP